MSSICAKEAHVMRAVEKTNSTSYSEFRLLFWLMGFILVYVALSLEVYEKKLHGGLVQGCLGKKKYIYI